MKQLYSYINIVGTCMHAKTQCMYHHYSSYGNNNHESTTSIKQTVQYYLPYLIILELFSSKCWDTWLDATCSKSYHQQTNDCQCSKCESVGMWKRDRGCVAILIVRFLCLQVDVACIFKRNGRDWHCNVSKTINHWQAQNGPAYSIIVLCHGAARFTMVTLWYTHVAWRAQYTCVAYIHALMMGCGIIILWNVIWLHS